MASTPRRAAFFSLSAQRKEPVVWSAPHHCERAALPLRRPRSTSCGTGGAKTRCAQTVCPLFPVPHPAARLSAKGLFSSPETRHASHRPLGGASVPLGSGGFLRAIVDCSHAGAWEQSFSFPSDFYRGHGPLLQPLAGRAGRYKERAMPAIVVAAGVVLRRFSAAAATPATPPCRDKTPG